MPKLLFRVVALAMVPALVAGSIGPVGAGHRACPKYHFMAGGAPSPPLQFQSYGSQALAPVSCEIPNRSRKQNGWNPVTYVLGLTIALIFPKEKPRERPVRAAVYHLDALATPKGDLPMNVLEAIVNQRLANIPVVLVSGRPYERPYLEIRPAASDYLADIEHHLHERSIAGSQRRAVLETLYIMAEDQVEVFNGFYMENRKRFPCPIRNETDPGLAFLETLHIHDDAQGAISIVDRLKESADNRYTEHEETLLFIESLAHEQPSSGRTPVAEAWASVRQAMHRAVNPSELAKVDLNPLAHDPFVEAHRPSVLKYVDELLSRRLMTKDDEMELALARQMLVDVYIAVKTVFLESGWITGQWLARRITTFVHKIHNLHVRRMREGLMWTNLRNDVEDIRDLVNEALQHHSTEEISMQTSKGGSRVAVVAITAFAESNQDYPPSTLALLEQACRTLLGPGLITKRSADKLHLSSTPLPEEAPPMVASGAPRREIQSAPPVRAIETPAAPPQTSSMTNKQRRHLLQALRDFGYARGIFPIHFWHFQLAKLPPNSPAPPLLGRYLKKDGSPVTLTLVEQYRSFLVERLRSSDDSEGLAELDALSSGKTFSRKQPDPLARQIDVAERVVEPPAALPTMTAVEPRGLATPPDKIRHKKSSPQASHPPVRQINAAETVVESQEGHSRAADRAANSVSPIIGPSIQLRAARWWQSVLDNYLRSLGRTRIPTARLLLPPGPIHPPRIGDIVRIGPIEYSIAEAKTDFGEKPLLILTAAGGNVTRELNESERASLLLESDAAVRIYRLPDPALVNGLSSSRVPVRRAILFDARSLWKIIQEPNRIRELLDQNNLTAGALSDFLKSSGIPFMNSLASLGILLGNLTKKGLLAQYISGNGTRYGWPQEPAGRKRLRDLETGA